MNNLCIALLIMVLLSVGSYCGCSDDRVEVNSKEMEEVKNLKENAKALQEGGSYEKALEAEPWPPVETLEGIEDPLSEGPVSFPE